MLSSATPITNFDPRHDRKRTYSAHESARIGAIV
ncbi:hypothetical protein G9444_6235 [Rhodococcus erythropolis]|uniref:Uncharacterized protein n=1 Tax=Rhodococcus erythropolis TaxID=1833 RepID=A0A6G9D2U2_RHOER|nr:hypothetical protein G9444_6235 [Rhodococcus erythropolis]